MIAGQIFYAHSAGTAGKLELLSDHLEQVSRLAAEFAAAFGAEEWGRVLGRWHDLGKYPHEFQSYLISSTCPQEAGEERGAPGRVDHSTFGARRAAQSVGGHRGQLLAFCIAGHHAGLPDATASDGDGERHALKQGRGRS